MKNKALPNNPTMKNLREWRGLSQKDLAKGTNSSRQLISLYETNQRTPGADKFIAIARELNVSLKTLARSLGISCEGIPDDISTRKIPEDE